MFNLFGILKGLVIEDPTDRTKQVTIQVSPSATTNTSTNITFSQTANRTITFPDADGSVVTPNSIDTFTNKTISGDSNTLFAIPGNEINAGSILPGSLNPSITDGITLDQSGSGSSIEIKAGGVSNTQVNAAAAIALTKLATTTANVVLETNSSGVITPSAVTTTTLGYLDATSSIQTQLDSKSTVSGSLINGDIVVGAGTSSVKTTGIAVDGSNNITGATSATIGSVTIGVTASNEISTTGSSALLLSNSGNSSQVVYTDKPFMAISPASGLTGSIAIREDQANGTNIVTLEPVAALAADRIATFPDASGTVILDTATQTLSNKTFSDAVTLTQIATPSNPAATKDRLYFKSDDKLYTLTSSGVETQLSGISITSPTMTVLTTGSGTYTTPAGVLYLRIRAIGGGGGGCGGGTNTNPTEGTDGGNTTISTITAGGGGKGRNYATAINSTGGSASGGNLNLPGSPGAPRMGTSTGTNGQYGASSYFGSGGVGGEFNNGTTPTNAVAPGSGGGTPAPSGAAVSGGAGGSGGYVEKIITSLSATYSYSVGAPGTAGSAGTSGRQGGGGASGIIIIEEYYQ